MQYPSQILFEKSSIDCPLIAAMYKKHSVTNNYKLEITPVDKISDSYVENDGLIVIRSHAISAQLIWENLFPHIASFPRIISLVESFLDRDSKEISDILISNIHRIKALDWTIFDNDSIDNDGIDMLDSNTSDLYNIELQLKKTPLDTLIVTGIPNGEYQLDSITYYSKLYPYVNFECDGITVNDHGLIQAMLNSLDVELGLGDESIKSRILRCDELHSDWTQLHFIDLMKTSFSDNALIILSFQENQMFQNTILFNEKSSANSDQRVKFAGMLSDCHSLQVETPGPIENVFRRISPS